MAVIGDAGLGEVVRAAQTIAVVGLSDNPARPSHGVAVYLKANGFTIIAVNPNVGEVLGEPALDSLQEIDAHVDIVNVFRRPEFCADVARDAVRIGAGTLWLQLGIRNDEALRIAEAAGLHAAQNRCLRIEHQRMVARGDRTEPSGGFEIGD